MKKSKTCYLCARWQGSCCGKTSIECKFSLEERICDNWIELNFLNSILDWITEMVQLGQREPE